MTEQQPPALLKLQRYGLIGFHASLVTLSATLIYGCVSLRQLLQESGTPDHLIFLTIICACANGIANARASWRNFTDTRTSKTRIDYDYIAFALALLMVMLASSLFAGL